MVDVTNADKAYALISGGLFYAACVLPAIWTGSGRIGWLKAYLSGLAAGAIVLLIDYSLFGLPVSTVNSRMVQLLWLPVLGVMLAGSLRKDNSTAPLQPNPWGALPTRSGGEPLSPPAPHVGGSQTSAQVEQYWLAEGENTIGPFTRTQAIKELRTKTDPPLTFVWSDGMADWARARDVPELLLAFAPITTGPTARPTTVPGIPKRVSVTMNGSAKETNPRNQRADGNTMGARLGDVLYWLGCIISVVIGAIGLWSLSLPSGEPVIKWAVVVLAVLVWLVGRACKYVLAGR